MGKAAREFDLSADSNGKKPTPHLSQEEEQKLRDFLSVPENSYFHGRRTLNWTPIKLEEDCVMVKLTHDTLHYCKKFKCSNEDLDEFFNDDAINIDIELLGKTPVG